MAPLPEDPLVHCPFFCASRQKQRKTQGKIRIRPRPPLEGGCDQVRSLYVATSTFPPTFQFPPGLLNCVLLWVLSSKGQSAKKLLGNPLPTATAFSRGGGAIGCVAVWPRVGQRGTGRAGGAGAGVADQLRPQHDSGLQPLRQAGREGALRGRLRPLANHQKRRQRGLCPPMN